MVAGFCSNEVRPKAAAVVYHAGRRAWALEIESFGQKANTMHFGRLDVLLGLLAEFAGIGVSPVQVDDNVVGQYTTRARMQTARSDA